MIKIQEILEDALPLIQKFAPTVGGALGGSFGFAAGYVLPILAAAFGANPGDIPQLVKNIMTDPDAPGKLEQVEQQHSNWVCALLGSVHNISKLSISVNVEFLGSGIKV